MTDQSPLLETRPPTRCPQYWHKHELQCRFDKGHDGRHEYVFVDWEDAALISAYDYPGPPPAASPVAGMPAPEPKLAAKCGHVAYRNGEDCIEDGCPNAAYQTPAEFAKHLAAPSAPFVECCFCDETRGCAAAGVCAQRESSAQRCFVAHPAPAEPLGGGEPRPMMCGAMARDEGWRQHYCTKLIGHEGDHGNWLLGNGPKFPPEPEAYGAVLTVQEAAQAVRDGKDVEARALSSDGDGEHGEWVDCRSTTRLLLLDLIPGAAEFRLKPAPQPQPAPQRSRVAEIVDEVFGPLGSTRYALAEDACNRVLREFVAACRARYESSKRTFLADFEDESVAWGLSGDAPGGSRK